MSRTDSLKCHALMFLKFIGLIIFFWENIGKIEQLYFKPSVQILGDLPRTRHVIGLLVVGPGVELQDSSGPGVVSTQCTSQGESRVGSTKSVATGICSPYTIGQSKIIFEDTFFYFFIFQEAKVNLVNNFFPTANSTELPW